MTEKLKQQPNYHPIDIIKDMQCEQGVEITYNKAFRAKETATAMINGMYEEGYKLLLNYCEFIKVSNPGTTVILNTIEENKFKGIFMCYSTSAAGFEHCRPLLSLNGMYLKSKYQGILLAVTGVDANGNLVPLAFAVVDAQNDDNSLWYLKTLRMVLEQHVSNSL